jgi:UDP-N-acetylglucosamine diphosphorylase/glucosamine-1-phosphate N-acetyltransferase
MGAPMFALYDDTVARGFEPFATSRPLGEMRAGAPLVRERWSHVLGRSAMGFVARAALRDFAELDAPPWLAGELPPGTIVVNTRALPFLAGTLSDAATSWTIGGRTAAVRLQEPLAASALAEGSWSLESLTGDSPRGDAIDGVWLDDVWDLVRHLTALLLRDIPDLASSLRCRALDDNGASARGPAVIGSHPVWLEDGATVEPFVVFDTSAGPVLLRRGALVQAFTRVTGPCFVGRDSTVTTDRVSGSSIGDVCRVHGELSASILVGHSNKGHDGFVGHSVLGRWVNLGASTVTSNLKNTYGTVALWTPDGVRDTGLQFLGTLFGDHAKTGIGLRLTTGCVLGTGANVMDAMPPKMVEPFSWGTAAPYDLFALEKFIDTATRMMARRGVALEASQQRMWRTIHAESANAPRHRSR